MIEFQVLSRIAETAGKNDKMRLLASCDTPQMRTILYLTMNKYLTYRIQQLDYPRQYNLIQPDVTTELSYILMELAKHQTGNNDAKLMIKRLLEKCTEEGARWVARIVNRDLNIGIDESSVNKVFPGLIPTFGVQLAKPLEDWNKLKYPVVVEEKLDGMRVIAIVRANAVSFYSREGRELFGLDPIGEEILRMFPGKEYCLDGEIIGKKLNPKCKTAMKNKDSNWAFAQALSMVKSQSTTREEVEEYLGFYAWDIIDLPYFLNQGAKKLEGKPLTQRKFELTALFERNKLDLKCVFLVPNAVCLNKEAVLEIFAIVRAKKGEGVMVKDPSAPYSFKRNDNILKLKEFFTYDLRIVGCYEGSPDSKYVGMLGGITVASDCGKIKSDVGSGFTDLDRAEMWLRYLNGTLLGSIVEIMFQEVTEDGSLRFPTFVRERTDKQITSCE